MNLLVKVWIVDPVENCDVSRARTVPEVDLGVARGYGRKVLLCVFARETLSPASS